MGRSDVFGSISVGDKLRAGGGLGRGFDMLRLTLAVGVVAWHSNFLLGNSNEDSAPYFWFPGYAILTMFFALSGFLIAGSAGRLRLRDFLVNRGMRIFPALAVEIVLSALILGPIFTNLPPLEYFSKVQTWKYFTNIIAVINYHLPGVFYHNKSNVVNISLWTVPYEFFCYGLMSIIIILGLIKRPRLVFLMAIVAIFFGMLGAYGFRPGTFEQSDRAFMRAYGSLFVGQQSRLTVGFLFGIVLFCMRDRIPYSGLLALLAAILCIAVACVAPATDIGYPIVNLVAALPLAYLTAFLGVSNIPTPAIFKKGDYSYGIYLYGWPMQQVMIAVFPEVRSVALQFAMAMVLVIAFAVFSWHAIEKPILKLRKKFSFVARERIQEVPVSDVAAPVAFADALDVSRKPGG